MYPNPILSGGKHRGKNIKNVWVTDAQYVHWLALGNHKYGEVATVAAQHLINEHEDKFATEGESAMSNEPKLYKVKSEKDKYGRLLTTDSQGNAVLEMLGGAGVQAFAMSEIEEVMPFTIGLAGEDGRVAHYQTKQGLFEKHDLLMIIEGAGFKIKRVVEVDSRRRNAAPLKGQISKLTAKLIEADDLVTVIE